jgi:hypothetical protein
MIVYMNQTIYEIDFTAQINALPEASCIYTVANALRGAGCVCWMAGGAVRDLWLARSPQDVDLVTNASDDTILTLFPKAILTGKKFGVYKLPFTDSSGRNIILDLTVFREEDKYIDGRRPEIVRRSTPEADAKRRDFTINALFYDLVDHEVIDFVGGVNDLQNKILRCVGNANLRFNEDHLRLLRLARFNAVFGFIIPAENQRAALESVELIKTVSGERIYEELLKVSIHSAEKKFWSLELAQKLWQEIGGNFNPQGYAKIEELEPIKFSPHERLIASLMLVGGLNESTAELLKARIKCSNDQYRFARKMIELAQDRPAIDLAVKIDADRESIQSLRILEFLSFDLYNQVNEYLRAHPVPLVTGVDLARICQPSEISVFLSLARKAQFENKAKTREEVLALLKKS